MMVQRKVQWFAIILCVLFLYSCASIEGMKTFDEMNPKERATWMMGVYNSQADDYKKMVRRPDLTNSQKEVLRLKKGMLERLWPMINTYTVYVDNGALPTREVEEGILQIINDMTAIVVPALEGG